MISALKLFLSNLKASFLTLKKPSAIAVTGMLLALKAVLGFMTVLVVPTVKIGFSFIPIVIGAMLYGPVPAMIIGGMGDILGYILNPVGGAYFPGFTVNGIVIGLIYGIFFFRKNFGIIRAVICELLIAVTVELGLSSLWLDIMLGNGYFAIMATRVLKCLVMLPIAVFVEIVLFKALPKIAKSSLQKSLNNKK